LSNSLKDNESDDDDDNDNNDNDNNDDNDNNNNDDNNNSNSNTNNDDDDDNDEPLATSLVPTGRNPVVLAHLVVRVIRASGMHHDTFNEVIKNGNSNQWWKGPDGKPFIIKQLQLLQDVRTRWDSMYLMLNRLRELQPVHPSNDNQSFLSLTRKFGRLLITSWRSQTTRILPNTQSLQRNGRRCGIWR
jgi:hypothetical protein